MKNLKYTVHVHMRGGISLFVSMPLGMAATKVAQFANDESP